jgi:hypothetical protein
MLNRWMSRALLSMAGLALLVSGAGAQLCPSPTDNFWKNDTLPDNPGGTPIIFSVIPGLCEGEAIGSFFQVAPGTPTQRLSQVSVGFGHSAGGGGFDATLNVEIYEGTVSFGAGGSATPGTKVFDLNADFSQSMQVTSTSINTFDMSPYNVDVSGDFAVVFRMNINVAFPGCPLTGAQANFFTDASGPTSCTPGVSLLDAQGTGWVDPAAWQPLPGIFLCPTFYNGNWVIRACSEDIGPPPAGTWENLGGGTLGSNGTPILLGSGPLTAGSLANLTLVNAPPNAIMLFWISLSSSPINAVGGTLFPLPADIKLILAADAFGIFQVSIPWAAGAPPSTEVWWQMIVQDNSSVHGITLSNGLKSTTPP